MTAATRMGAFLRLAARRHWHLLAVCTVIVPVVTYALGAHRPAEYRAAATVIFGSLAADDPIGHVPAIPEDQRPDDLAATDRSLLQLPETATAAARALGGRVSAGYVRAHVEVLNSSGASADASGTGAGSNVWTIAATEHDPALAARLVNAYAEQFVEGRRTARAKELRSVRTTLVAALRRAEAGGSETLAARQLRAELRQNASDLELAASLAGGGVRVLGRAATPTAAVGRHEGRLVMAGAGLGLLLGLTLAVIFTAADPRLASLPAVRTALAAPLLAAVPRSRALGGPDRALAPVLPQRERDAFRALRLNLRHAGSGAVLVTSAVRGEGRSTVAWNLAAAEARAGARVLLIEADVHRPVLAGRLGIGSSAGLAGVLAGTADRVDAVREVGLAGDDGAVVDVLPAGVPSAEAADRIGSALGAALIAECRRDYDLVVVDAPPVTMVADAIPLLRHVDGVVLVHRLDRTSRETAEGLQLHLARLGAPVLGLVVNAVGADAPAALPAVRRAPGTDLVA